jgi:Holliday junction resolvasome RuvABC endonuclease subunit
VADSLRVLGLDTSPSSTGWGKAWGQLLGPAPEFGTIRPGIVVPKTGNLDLSAARMGKVITRLGPLVSDFDPDLIVMEGPSYGSTGAYWHENAGLWWEIVLRIKKSGRALVIITPATLKKFATGSGNAKKSAMVGAAVHRFGLEKIGEDEADGLWAAAAGCQHYGWPLVKLPAAQVAALDVVKKWPVLEGPVTVPA